MLALVMNVQRWKRELVAHQHTTRFSEGIVCSFLLHREYVEERIGKYGVDEGDIENELNDDERFELSNKSNKLDGKSNNSYSSRLRLMRMGTLF